MRAFTLPIIALAALAACDSGTPAADETSAAVEPSAEVTPTPIPTASPTLPGTEIPSAILGRWGLVANDCDPARDDAKGLLTITATKLEFYESVGTLDHIEEISPTRIRATFDFEGEGMTWERDQVLDVQDNGATLIRREFGEDAAPGPLRYAKCN